MARLFYFSDTGDIYGVHPGEPDPAEITLPEGVTWIDVPEAPNKIPWPSLPDGRRGSEHTSRVENGSLVVGDVPPDEVDTFMDNPVTRALILAINDGTLPVGQNLSETDIKDRIRTKMS